MLEHRGRTASPPAVRTSFLLRLGAIATGVGAIGWLTVVTTVASIARDGNPALALRFAPYDSGANARQADRLLQLGDDRRLAAEHARKALERSPLSPVGARVLGFTKEAQGDRAGAHALLMQAGELSRRDLATRLWLIEDAVARNDVSGALRQFDLAMRSSATARSILFPILTNAIADDAFVDPVVELLRSSPNWAPEFVVNAAATGQATENLSEIVARVPSLGDPNRGLRQILINQLVREQKYDAAARFFAAVKNHARSPINNNRFQQPRGALTPLEWEMSGEVGHGAEFTEGGLRLYADSSSGGPVARQLLTLPPGTYQLQTTGYARSADPYGGADWIIDCAEPAPAHLLTLRLPTSPGSVGGEFSVPAGCTGQWLRLGVRSGQSPDGVVGLVREVRLIRADG